MHRLRLIKHWNTLEILSAQFGEILSLSKNITSDVNRFMNDINAGVNLKVLLIELKRVIFCYSLHADQENKFCVNDEMGEAKLNSR